MPLALRLAIILVIAVNVIPIARIAFEQLPAFGIGRPRKMTAEQTASALPRHLYWVPQHDPRRDVRCEEHSRTPDAQQGRTGAWDYICTFVPRPDNSLQRLKVGVRVGDASITTVSQQYEIDAPFVR